jgi:hypothetical protein
MFKRAFAGLPLTPAQRSLLKLIKAVAFAVLAFILGGQGLSALNAIQQPGANAGKILHDTLLTPVLMIVLLTVEKYFTAQGDDKYVPLLAQAADIQQTPAGLTVTAAPQPAPTAPSTAPAAASAL